MKNKFRIAEAIVITLITVCCRAVFAADPVPTTAASVATPDKWQYTLFNPTPPDQLRGMDTDRPNVTNTPHTIDAGHLQIEAGVFDYTYYRNKYQGANARSDAFDFGQLNFRVGVLNNLELNAVINAADFVRNTDFIANQSSRQNGFGDMVVGGKFNFWGNDGNDAVWATAFAIQPQFKIPTARENIGNGHPELSVGLPLLVNLPADMHLSLQTAVSWQRNSTNDGEVTGWQNAASIDRVFFERFDFYLEYVATCATEHHQISPQTIDVGVTCPLNDNLALDTGVNFGLNRATNNVEWVAGVSARF